MNPATHLYKTSVLAIRIAALAAALFVTTSAPARTAHTANPKEGGETPRPNPTRTSCATTIRASRSTWGSDCGAFRCPWTTTATV